MEKGELTKSQLYVHKLPEMLNLFPLSILLLHVRLVCPEIFGKLSPHDALL